METRNSRGETALWHGQALMPGVKSAEVVIVRGEGAYIWDESGNRLLDVPAGLWYCNIGHGRQEMATAIAKQLSELAVYHTFQAYANRPALELAERIVSSATLGPGAKVFFGNGGSDAVEIACKLARRYWDACGSPSKRTIIARDRSYHGLHAFGTSIGGLEAFRRGYGSLVPDTMRVATNSWQALEKAVKEAGRDTIAAFIAEPVLGAGGVVLPSDDYLAQAQRICRENDILFIVDEVVTGFGRVGELFACHRYGLEPDMMLFAKAVTSGYIPLSGTVISERVADPFWRDGSTEVFRHGLTYAGHPTACSAGLANLDILEREDLPARVRELEPRLAAELRRLEDHPNVVEVRTGVGLLGGVQIADPVQAQEVCVWCCEHGLLARLVGDGDTIQISPPLIITDEEIKTMSEVIGDALEEVAARQPDSAMAASPT